ncbi:hypothetical protein LEP1GSC170_3973 [Leptospira interrogans serovar Bataviae str. HAI135]|nr:hypothetical protein LEP1GSC170_3973 [Leptospira interrogans serovar Bataviae str. HAI135]
MSIKKMTLKDKDLETFERLKIACEKLKINRNQLAHILRMHPSNATKLLNGTVVLTWANAELFQFKTNVSANWVMLGTGEFWYKSVKDDNEGMRNYTIMIVKKILSINGLNNVLEDFLNLSEEDQKFVISMIRHFGKKS